MVPDVEECLKKARAKETRIAFGVGIVGHVAQTKEIINIKDIQEVSSFISFMKLIKSTTHSSIVVVRHLLYAEEKMRNFCSWREENAVFTSRTGL